VIAVVFVCVYCCTMSKHKKDFICGHRVICCEAGSITKDANGRVVDCQAVTTTKPFKAAPENK
jgi:hypothetical protein